jgi:hypothetical protein
MPGKLVLNEELRRRLIKLLERKYGRMHGSRTQINLRQIDYENQLIRDVYKRRSMYIEEIESNIRKKVYVYRI